MNPSRSSSRSNKQESEFNDNASTTMMMQVVNFEYH